jgi:hypothetical protein
LIATETNANGMTVQESVTISSGATTTSSAYARKGTNDWMLVIAFDGSTNGVRQWFNLATGAVGSSTAFGTGFSKVSASITEQGSGLYRWSFTANTTGTNFRVAIYPNVPADLDFDCTIGDVGYVGFVQVEAAPTPSSYIPTNSGSTVTRSADVLTIPAANLPWPSPVVIGPELVTNGTFDTDISGWTTVLGSASWSAGQISVARGGGGLGRVSAPITCEIGKVYRFTGYQDKGTTGSVTVTLAISSTSTVGAIAIFSSVTAGTFDLVFVATQTTHWVLLQNGSGSDGDAALFGNISVREINPLAVSIQMDGRVTYADEDSFTTGRFYRWGTGSTASISSLLNTFGANTGVIDFEQASGGVFDYSSSSNVYTPSILTSFNIASRNGSTFVQGAVDGAALTSNTTPVALPDLSATDLTLGFTYNGTIRTFRIWAQDIGDAGLVEATEPSLVPSLSLTFDGTENSFIVEDWSE